MANDYFEQEESWKPYRDLVNLGNPGAALAQCLQALDDYRSKNTDYAAQHKGTPYYVMGYCALATHDFSGATLFFDAALSEDQKYHPATDTPAKQFMRLENDKILYLAGDMIKGLVADTEELLKDYNARSGAAGLTMADLRARFFEAVIKLSAHNARALATTFISFIAEWKYRRRLLELADGASRDVLYVHLFRGCVLFESLLKENPKYPTKQSMLGGVLGELRNPLGINGIIMTSAASFGDAIIEVGKATSVEEAIMAAGKLRNTLGHKISWPSANFTPHVYDQAICVVASACLHAIAKLY